MNRREILKSAAALSVLSFGVVPQRGALAQPATPAGGEVEPMLEGFLSSNAADLPTAEEGEIQIVVQSAPFGSYVGFIVQNNSDKSVGIKEVIGVAHDADGGLFGVMRIAHVSPYVIGPGNYSIGVATFDRDLEADMSIELAPGFEDVDSLRRGYVDLTVTEASVEDDTVIGTVENQTDSDAADLSNIVGLFFDETGEIVGLARPYLDSDVPAGGTTTFSEHLDGGTATDSYVFAASGREA